MFASEVSRAQPCFVNIDIFDRIDDYQDLGEPEDGRRRPYDISADPTIHEWFRIASDRSHSPDYPLMREETVGIIARALDRLPENEAVALSLSFFAERPLSEVGEALGVSQSRACQIKKNAIRKLREHLGLLEHLRDFLTEAA